MKKYLDIFVRFFRVGTLTFGGGLSMLPIIERELSDGEKPYLDKEAISDDYAMAQCAPGTISVNTSILCGYQIGGTLEGIVAAFGVSMPSVIIILIVASLMQSFMSNHYLAIALMGVRSGVCALVLNTLFGFVEKQHCRQSNIFYFCLCVGSAYRGEYQPCLLGAFRRSSGYRLTFYSQ